MASRAQIDSRIFFILLIFQTITKSEIVFARLSCALVSNLCCTFFVTTRHLVRVHHGFPSSLTASSPASLSPGISLRTSVANSSSSSQFSTQSVAYARKAAADRVMVLRGPAAVQPRARVCIARKHSIRIRAPNLDAGPHAPCERQRHIGTAIFVTSETWYALRVLHLLRKYRLQDVARECADELFVLRVQPHSFVRVCGLYSRANVPPAMSNSRTTSW